ncbi:MAG: septal ring lytic transglycosylase RlpA family protein [Haliscomenobacter sp.]|nr:septal ring lytic transglycosylase RlpA family protein [Haliscomenobacter sp.]
MNKSFSFLALFAIISATSVLHAQETGIAAVYQASFQGSKTASGKPYDKNQLTAAHKIHPMGTQLRVTRTDEASRRSVVVTVNDRGPYISGRIIELSSASGRRIGLSNETSTANVVLEVVGKVDETSQPKPAAPTVPNTNIKETKPAAPTVSTTNINTPPPVVAEPPAKAQVVKAETPPAKPTSAAKGSEATPVQVNEKTYPLARNPDQKFGLFKIALHQSANKGFGVQVMSLNSPDNLLQQITQLQSKWFDNVLVSVEPGPDGKTPHYKMLLGPFQSEEQARTYNNNLKKKFKINGFVVDLGTIAY